MPKIQDKSLPPTLGPRGGKGRGGIASRDQELFAQGGAGLVWAPEIVSQAMSCNQGQECAIAIHPHCIGRGPTSGPQGKEYLSDGSAYTMDSRGVSQAVCFSQNQLGEVRAGKLCGTLNTNSNASGRNTPMIQSLMQVRRLTPRECERLQGFPDDHTAIPFRGKPAADSPRYRALGNSMAVPVVRWLAVRIAQFDKEHQQCQK